MRAFMNKIVTGSLILVAGLSLTTASFAEEQGSAGKSVSGFFKRLFKWPVKTVQNTGEMTANTLNNTGDKVLSQTGEKLSQGQLPEAIGQTVTGTAETTGQTVSETVQAPVKAAGEEEKPAS